jgi:peptidyl-prolyl cis-trans isomerase A (cyclophilin A)
MQKSAVYPPVKSVILLLVLTVSSQAELLATFQTSRGDVTTTLHHDKAPQTVANFITLAQGTRARIDPRTGALTRAPLYTGEKFFRVLDSLNGNPDFKIAQTGSGSGTNAGGPGYTFRDEFDPTLTHVPYVLSMANSASSSGPHTNGSQIFFTGSAPIPGLDGIHTVFGLVTDPASRAVIDAIIAAGSDATTITGITFARTDAAALAFDESAQNLPECLPAPGNLQVSPGIAADYLLSEPLKPGSVLLAHHSNDLAAWSYLGQVYHGTGQPGFSDITLDAATQPRNFYHLSTIIYPDALVPASLVSRELFISLSQNRTLLFQFDSTGEAGTLTYSETPATPYPFVLQVYSTAPYKATWIMNTTGLGRFRISGILDGEKDEHLLGTHQTEQWNGLFWFPISGGGLSLTK